MLGRPLLCAMVSGPDSIGLGYAEGMELRPRNRPDSAFWFSQLCTYMYLQIIE